MSSQRDQKIVTLLTKIPWTESELPDTKLDPIRRFMYGNQFSEVDIQLVLMHRQKRMNCEYTRRCREKLQKMKQEKDDLTKTKQELLKEIEDLKSQPSQ